MSRFITSRMYSCARTQLVMLGDEIVFHFRESEFFEEMEKTGQYPTCWKKVLPDGKDAIWVCQSVCMATPYIPSDTDRSGDGIEATGYASVGCPSEDFPEGIPRQDWLGCEVYLLRTDSDEAEFYMLEHVPQSDGAGKLKFQITFREIVGRQELLRKLK